MKTIKDFRNELLKRKEIVFSIDAISNPGFTKMREECAKYFNAEIERVVVRNVSNKFGSKEFFIEAFIYDSAKDKEKIEQKPKPKKEAKK